jgi:hypothetical protein
MADSLEVWAFRGVRDHRIQVISTFGDQVHRLIPGYHSIAEIETSFLDLHEVELAEGAPLHRQ